METHRVDVDGCGIHVTVDRALRQSEGSRRALALTDVADVVVPDQRGHGLSDLSIPETWNLDTWADDLAALPTVEQVAKRIGTLGGDSAE